MAEALPFSEVRSSIERAQADVVTTLEKALPGAEVKMLADTVEAALGPLMFAIKAQNLLLGVMTQLLIENGNLNRQDLVECLAQVEVSSPDMATIVAVLQGSLKPKN